jgi:hypothetical protein
MTQHAACSCGQLRAECTGDPVRVSVCHCLACQRRTGSAFGVAARWPEAQVRATGEKRTWTRVADSGGRAHYNFCPQCGSTVTYTHENWPGLVAIPVGAFADPAFSPPHFSVYEHRKHRWTIVLGEHVEHSSTDSAARTGGTR